MINSRQCIEDGRLASFPRHGQIQHIAAVPTTSIRLPKTDRAEAHSDSLSTRQDQISRESPFCKSNWLQASCCGTDNLPRSEQRSRQLYRCAGYCRSRWM